MNRSSYLLLFILLILSVPAFSQKSKSQLEREKQENLRKIREANRILKETQSRKTSTLAQLAVIKKEIEARNELINSISEEIELLNGEIEEKGEIITSLENDVQRLKQEYAQMIYEASKSQSYYDKLTFIFSAETFNQLVMRLKYFRQFADARKYQVEQIEKVMSTLASQKVRLNVAWQEKNALLKAKQDEQESLNNLEQQQNDLIAELNKKEKELKVEVAQRERENKKLEKLIEDIVKREIAKARREEAERKAREAKMASSDKSSGIAGTPEVAALSATFEKNAKKLPWPVGRGQIVGHFGKQVHPVLKGVTVENLGIDIVTLKDEPVRAVFDGKVVTIASVPGMNTVVMIQHGEYYTVYARLKSVTVKNGQQVKAKDLIGQVYSGKDGDAQLQFQVWKNNVKLDPELWLYKK